jgi:hypothetical protein
VFEMNLNNSKYMNMQKYPMKFDLVIETQYRWGDPSVEGGIILGWTFRKWDVGVWTGLGWLRVGKGGGRL